VSVLSPGEVALPQWLTSGWEFRVSAPDESGAKGEVAQALGLDAGDLLAYSAEIFR
jgi:hypothetical protein